MNKKIIPSTIPIDLQKLEQWVCWRFEKHNGNLTKPPISAITGKLASSVKPTDWSSFDTALAYYENHEGIEGIGFVFSESDPFCGIDLDSCVQEGEIEEWAQNIIKKFNSYSEISPSGKGVHIIIEGKKKGKLAVSQTSLPGVKDSKIEIYDNARYFTFTGNAVNAANVVSGTKEMYVKHRQNILDEFYDFLFDTQSPVNKTSRNVQKRTNASENSRRDVTVHLSNQTLIQKAKEAKNGGKFTALWEGNVDGYKSHSEADLALCCLLGFWTQEEKRIDELFRDSGLYRDKWEREDYRENTLRKAIELVSTSNSLTQMDIDETAPKWNPETVVEVVETTSLNQIPLFPQLAWRGIFEDFRLAHTNTTEAPDEFLFAAALGIAGIVLGRKAWIWYSRKLYPNFYTVTVGTTARTRKTTAADKAEDFLQRTCPNVLFYRGLATSEGLILLLTPIDASEEEEIDELIETSTITIEETSPRYQAQKARFQEGVTEFEGVRLLCQLGEFSALLKKAAKESSAGLTETLIDAYDNPTKLDNPTRSSPLSAPKPSISIIATTTTGRLMRHLGMEEMEGGFANRFVYFIGERKPAIPWPPEPVIENLNQAVRLLAEARQQWHNTQFYLQNEARQLWEAYYYKWYNQSENDIIDPVTGRLPDSAVKLALLYAATENEEPVVLAEQMEAAVAVANYWNESIKALFSNYGLTDSQQTENKILQAVANGGKSKEELYKYFSKHIDARTLNVALDNLQKIGTIAQIKLKQSKGRPKTLFKLATDE